MTASEKHLHTGCVSLVPIFNHLDNESMHKIGQKAQSRLLDRLEYLYQADEKDESVYIVHSGQVRIFHLSESGKEQLIRILNPGDFTGEWTIFSPNTYHKHYAQATRKSSICTINRNDLLELLDEYPEISMKILASMSERLQQSEKQTASVATEQVSTRIIYYLEELTAAETDDTATIKLPMTRKDLASYLGTTPETLSRRFTDLENEGLIKQLPKNKIHIYSIEELLFSAE